MSTIPSDLKYTKTHEWVRVEGDTALVGITDFAQQELSDIVYVEITALGKKVKQSEPIGFIEAVKATSDIYAPLSGEIIEANPQINKKEGDAPAMVNRDPYGLGWLCKIKITNPDELASLLDHEAYANLVQRSQHH
ncbi:MAG: glycine cleavage system protein GcvH [candidate division WOR-3 bacterium]|jgi:glycine cleavage system H protein|nr:glycine cleavage system protein GcvH [candidate division WOR-3 bacterium]MDH7518548.1 glycine cleavage system protein GcvH [bacterium]